MFVFDLNKLLKGDIILERTDDNISKLVMELSHSQFSHAILYVGDTSCLEADDIVISFNLQRKLVEHKEDVCVLRLKETVAPMTMENIILNARMNVGMQYSINDAKAIISEKLRSGNLRRQTCTRFVAQAFAKAGIDLVKDANFCSPEELLKSEKLYVVKDVLREATEGDIKLANSESILPKQHQIIKDVLAEVRKATMSDVQKINELKDFAILHPEFDETIAEILTKSGYLEMWKEEEKMVPQQYDLLKFIDYYGKQSVEVALRISETSQLVIARYMFCYYQLLQDMKKYGHLKVVRLFFELYENLTNFTMRRLAVAKTVLDYVRDGLVDDNYKEAN